MDILIIGGTLFLGRHIVEAALERGHRLTLFNRGQTNPEVFPEIETILGDRETDLDKLAKRKWDAVIDTCGYFPRIVGLSAQNLRNAVKTYVFISSISVYTNFSTVGITEDHPVATIEDETVEEITGETYGAIKALCEKAVEDFFPGRALIIRPGLIVGPHDPTDRFTYWPTHVARGGSVLAPENSEIPVQIIDVRDLADFTIKLIEQKRSGTYNVTGPDYELQFGTILETCKQVSGSNASFVWASADFLAQNNVAPWSDLPVWVPDTTEDAGFSRVDVSKAVAAGLTFRPLDETVRDTLDWAKTRPTDYEMRAGLKPEREAELLELLKKDAK
ncbi:MAG: NAD-dependent epimerase/dehydratase family protein [Anaerolineales bacterium]|jgi:2'-hydroxyisoflavone reductase